MKTYLTEKSWYDIIPNFYPITSEQYNQLWSLKPINDIYIPIMGKPVKIPRKQALYGNSKYSFSNITVPSEELKDPLMIDILNKINTIDDQNEYNGIFVNWYENGDEYIGWHSDDERDLKYGAPIYSISFGATRKFKIKVKKTEKVTDIFLEHGMLLIMGGDMQKECKHSVPKTKQCNKSRINFTIRCFN